ncbi:MAG: tetratricopeptide repeat protein [Bacteroidaceae bacterium]|nr:tetratricopeptide repeat protein [Bacteroidaceae bacterium]
MKKIGLIALALATVTGVYAQKGVEDGSRYGHGQDSINTLKNISIYSEFYKTANYKEAYESGWKEVFHDAPLASVNTYTYGIKILQSLYNDAKKEKNTELMTQYSNELFEVFDQRLKYLDQLNAMAKNKVTEADVYGQYGHAYRVYNPKVSISRAYELLRKAVDLGQGETQYYVLDDLMTVSAQRYTNKKDNTEYRDALIQDYLDCASFIDVFIANHQDDEKVLSAATTVKENIDGHFVKSGAADCESLQNIYGPKIEDNKDNLEYLTKVVNLMSIFECQSSDAYLTAAEYAHKISPTAKTAKALGKLYIKQREDYERALEFYDQAIELATDKNDAADTYYTMATIYFSKDNYDRSRSCLQKCLSNNPNKGDAYILMAQLYAVKHDWSSEPALNRCAYFAVIDKLEQAKKVDSSVASKANDLISQYKKQCPQADDLFMLGYKVGDQVEIKGWINETTTIR